MDQNRSHTMATGFIFSLLMCTSMLSHGQDTLVNEPVPSQAKIYINADSGNNSNNGDLQTPLLTLDEAAKRITNAKGSGPITIYLSKGVYGMQKTADFNPANWKFTKNTRLTIRAEVLPNGSSWNPSDMPVLISTMPFSVEKNDKGQVTGAQNFGILIQSSHVTIQGLRILGEPVHENPSPGILIRNYPIVWEGKDLEDLRITECLFIGNRFAIPNHLGVLANGRNLEVYHCVFYGVKDAVVMWNSPATNSSFHHNLVLNSYGGIVCTWSATQDFRFHNNVISNANVLWLFDKDQKLSYTINNSIIVGYKSLANKGGGAHDFGEKADTTKLKINKNVILRKSGKLEVVEDQTNNRYLHIKTGTLGSDLGAGLFAR